MNLQDPTTDSLATFADSPTEEYPNSLAAAVRACKHGVKRTHVIDAHVPGALLVELYSRDGLGVMVSGEKQFQDFGPSVCTQPCLWDDCNRLYRHAARLAASELLACQCCCETHQHNVPGRR